MEENKKLTSFKIHLKNKSFFKCDNNTTILNASIEADKTLEYSCKTGKCRSCIVKVIEGKTENIQDNIILSNKEIDQGFVLSCIAKPTSDLKLDIENIENITLNKVKTIPCKIDSIQKVSKEVLNVVLRLPPNNKFKFISGQYVNIIFRNIRRSYSIANNQREDNKLEFFIKNYDNGLMSEYWFNRAKINDLLRIEGPLGTFFLRESIIKNIIFLATGTGIAPIKAIIEQISRDNKLLKDKKFFVFWGGRYISDIFWRPELKEAFVFVPVLSRKNEEWEGETGYVQDTLLKKIKNVKEVQVYACGSNKMIASAKEVLIQNGLLENNFFSDAFVSSN